MKYRNWLVGMPVPKPDQDDLYWRNLNKLSHLIANHLEIVKETESSPKKDQVTLTTQSIIVTSIKSQTSLIVSSDSNSKPTLWIAEPTEDLIDQWEALAEAVKQAGYNYRPSGLETYPRSSEADFLSKLRSDLGGAHLFVQLLGQTSGRRSKESNISFTALQNAAAFEFAKQQINFLQWRSRDIKLENVVDDTYRQLLTGAIACGFEEFRQRVLTTLQNLNSDSTTNKYPNTSDGSLAICISADVADRDLGHRISDILVELGADALTAPTPTQGQVSSVFNAQLDEVICGSEGVIIVYGQSHPLWVQAQYNQARKALLAQKRKGIWGALLNGPPHDKSDAGVASKNLMMLDCRDGPERRHIEQFVNALRETSHA
ncbi:MAG: hypothetical protein IPN42_00050 [Methylococcaceae bacterium]|nr:hypothetical protein [Methylococcaceae bacterium]